ncbi:MAG: hypothetical protein O2940_06935 [Actinomycetota bacterium]|jgi:hypothetical protein|nr:hypothetical protein [Actinomycetota bacterium]
MTTRTLETILDSEINNQPATKADLRNLGMHFESQFAMVDARFAQVDVRLTEIDTKVTNLGTQIRLDLDAFEVRMEKSINRNLRQSTIVLIGFALTAIGILAAVPIFS